MNPETFLWKCEPSFLGGLLWFGPAVMVDFSRVVDRGRCCFGLPSPSMSMTMAVFLLMSIPITSPPPSLIPTTMPVRLLRVPTPPLLLLPPSLLNDMDFPELGEGVRAAAFPTLPEQAPQQSSLSKLRFAEGVVKGSVPVPKGWD